MKIICINGAPTCGKDTFVSLCQKYLLWCGNFSTVDFVKEIAATCGWDGTKTPENRKFLSDLKDLLTEWNDIPYKKIEKAIDQYVKEAERYDFSSEDVLCFIHCREPKEIAKFVDRLGAKTLLIRRPEVESKKQSNHADNEVFNYNYDYTITNDGSLWDLEKKAGNFIMELGYRNLRIPKK
jgi:hypothetical protein